MRVLAAALACQSSSRTYPCRKSLIPALRILLSRAKGAGVGADSDQKIGPGAGVCQRGAQMGCTEENKMVQSLWPGVTCKRCVVTRATCHKAPHAVTHDRQLFDRVRPIAQDHFHDVGKFMAVGGDMPAAVVVEVHRRVAEIAREDLTVIVALSTPLQIVHAQTV